MMYQRANQEKDERMNSILNITEKYTGQLKDRSVENTNYGRSAYNFLTL